MDNVIPFRRTDSDMPIPAPIEPKKPDLVIRHKRTKNLIAFPKKGETIEDSIARLVPEYGTRDELEAMEFETAYDEYESKFKSEPVQISETDWQYALEVLPPLKWRNGSNAESFMCSEFTCGRLTAIYVRSGKRYFSFTDNYRMTHDEILARLYQSKAYKNLTL
jgi:hypothetical protein